MDFRYDVVNYIRQCYSFMLITSALALHHFSEPVWTVEMVFDIQTEYSVETNIRIPLQYKGIILQLYRDGKESSYSFHF